MVKWWPFGRRRKSQAGLPAVPKPESPSSLISRRALIWGSLAVGLGAAVIAPKWHNHYKNHKSAVLARVRIEELRALARGNPPILTSRVRMDEFNRLKIPYSPHSRDTLQKVIEDFPEIKRLEMSWVKYRGLPGIIFASAEKREETETKDGEIDDRVSSKLHTHPESKTLFEIPEEHRSAFKDFSLTDVLSLQAAHLLSATAQRKGGRAVIKGSSVAILDKYGKLIGYVAVRIGKKYYSDGLIMQLEKINNDINQILFGLLVSKKDWEGAIAVLTEYRTLLEKKGMHFRYIPAKGYIFKDGYFQKKK